MEMLSEVSMFDSRIREQLRNRLYLADISQGVLRGKIFSGFGWRPQESSG
jgi:hypothetical protein